jgi:hypothetical protein
MQGQDLEFMKLFKWIDINHTSEQNGLLDDIYGSSSRRAPQYSSYRVQSDKPIHAGV